MEGLLDTKRHLFDIRFTNKLLYAARHIFALKMRGILLTLRQRAS
jgi:hypothetical protein